MNVFWKIFVCGFFSANAFASIKTGTQCSTVDQFNATVGTECVTSQGATFQRFQSPNTNELGWKDLNGVIWYDSIVDNLNWGDARDFCENKGQKLPSNQDFMYAILGGFTDVLKDMTARNSWSNTIFAPANNGPTYGIYYDGNLEDTDDDYISALYSARCIERYSDGPQPIPQLGEVARNAKGNLQIMKQEDAIKFCENVGQHLPSALELAQLSQSKGSIGISAKPKYGFNHIGARSADGQMDDFYFNWEGYVCDSGDFLCHSWFWSSSAEGAGTRFGYILSGISGAVYAIEVYNLRAAFCIIGKR